MSQSATRTAMNFFSGEFSFFQQKNSKKVRLNITAVSLALTPIPHDFHSPLSFSLLTLLMSCSHGAILIIVRTRFLAGLLQLPYKTEKNCFSFVFFCLRFIFSCSLPISVPARSENGRNEIKAASIRVNQFCR